MVMSAGIVRKFVTATAAVVLGPLIAFAGILFLHVDHFNLAWIYAVLLAPAVLCGMAAYFVGCRWFSVVVGLLASASAIAPIAYFFSHLDFSGM